MRRWFWVAVGVYAAVWAYAAATLPAQVPVHFGPSGGADRFASRTEALVTFAVLGVVLTGVLVWADRVVARGSLHLVNVPHRRWWTASAPRAERLRAMLRRDGAVLAVATMALMVVVLSSTLAAAASDDPRLGWVFFVAFALYAAATLAWAVRMYRGRYHPRSHPDLGEPA